MGTKKNGLSPSESNKGFRPFDGLGRRKEGAQNGVKILDLNFHSVVSFKENRSLNNDHPRAAISSEDLGISNLVPLASRK